MSALVVQSMLHIAVELCLLVAVAGLRRRIEGLEQGPSPSGLKLKRLGDCMFDNVVAVPAVDRFVTKDGRVVKEPES